MGDGGAVVVGVAGRVRVAVVVAVLVVVGLLGPAPRAGAVVATSVSGWSTSAASGAVGFVFTDAVSVKTGSGFVKRSVRVQRRPAGGSWATISTGTSSASGAFTAALPVPGKGTFYFRLVVPATQTAASRTTASRKITGITGTTTTVSGWSTTATSAPASTGVGVTVTVKTGTGYPARSVQVQRKPSTGSTWSTQSTTTSGSNGRTKVKLTGTPGVWDYRLHVTPTRTAAAATTKTRRVTLTGPGALGSLIRVDLGSDGSPAIWSSALGTYHDAPRREGLSWSPDGSRVTFVGCVDDSTCQIFSKNLSTGAIQLVSGTATNQDAIRDPRTAANSWPIAWSADSTSVIFHSNASNLGQAACNCYRVYRKNLATGTVDSIPTPSDGHDWDSVAVAGATVRGTKVAWEELNSPSAGWVAVRDLETASEFIRYDGRVTGFSPNGELYATVSRDAALGSVREMSTGAVIAEVPGAVYQFSRDSAAVMFHDEWGFHLLSLGSKTRRTVLDSELDSEPFDVTLSPDGTWIVFASRSALLSVDTNGASDVYVKDLTSGRLSLVSADAIGQLGDTETDSAVLSPDGRHVMFRSWVRAWSGASDGAPHIYVKAL